MVKAYWALKAFQGNACISDAVTQQEKQQADAPNFTNQKDGLDRPGMPMHPICPHLRPLKNLEPVTQNKVAADDFGDLFGARADCCTLL
jgi:hypothetical protein